MPTLQIRPCLSSSWVLGLVLACALPGCTCSSTTEGAAHGAAMDAGAKPKPGTIPDAGGGIFLPIEAGATGFRIEPGVLELTVNPALGKPDPVQFTVTGGGGTAVTWQVS